MGCTYRHRVHHGIDGHTRQLFLFFEWYAETVECVDKRRVNLVEALGALRVFGCGIVAYGLEVDGRNREVSPCGWLKCEPVTVSLQSEVEKPVGFAFLTGDEAYDILRQSGRNNLCVYVGCKSVFIFARGGVGYHVA